MISWIPFAWLISFYSFALATAIHLNGPIYRINPNSTPFDVLYSFALGLFMMNLLSLPLWLACYVVFKVAKVPIPKGTRVYLLGLTLTLLQFFLDPGKLVVWFLD